MTDDLTVVASLPASNTIPGVVQPTRPTLIVRCAEKRLDIYVSLGTVVNPDYGELYEASGRTRFGTDPAEDITFGIADGHDAVFFPSGTEMQAAAEAKVKLGIVRRGESAPVTTWAQRLVSHPASRLLVEVPTYNAGSQVITFDLDAADKAVAEVATACGVSTAASVPAPVAAASPPAPAAPSAGSSTVKLVADGIRGRISCGTIQTTFDGELTLDFRDQPIPSNCMIVTDDGKRGVFTVSAPGATAATCTTTAERDLFCTVARNP